MNKILLNQENCIYECKLKWALERCKCLPWFIKQYREIQNVTVCNIFGNKCYEQKMLQANMELNFATTAEIPDCNCYSDCNAVKYYHMFPENNYKVEF